MSRDEESLECRESTLIKCGSEDLASSLSTKLIG